MTGLRIAVADDEALIRRYFDETLAEMGHSVAVSAANGRELVEGCRAAAASAAGPIDLDISDNKMPEMDGNDAAIEIIAERPVPVILVSAFHDADLIERAEASRVMAYLIKPIQRADLEAAIAIARRRFEQFTSLENDAADLRRHLEERKLIEKAKGLLMQKTGISEAEAHKRLQKTACDTNTKLVDVARMIVNAAPALDLFRKP